MSKKEVVFENFIDEASGLEVRKTEWVAGCVEVSQKKRPLSPEEFAEIFAEVRTDGSNG